MVKELRARNASARDISESEDDDKNEWTERVRQLLAEAAMDEDLSPMERRARDRADFMRATGRA